MADNVAITAGSGTTIATDDVSGVHFQRVKIVDGTLDSSAAIAGSSVYGLRADIARLPSYVTDTFGKLQTVNCLNDIDVQFWRDVPANLVTVTSANGGTATQTTGLMQLATTTATAGEVKVVSLDNVLYRSGGEIFCLVTTAWLNGGVAGCNQRIGLYDTNNGFFIGWEGATFGFTQRQNAVDTQTARASWNGDPLDGSASSKFTRAGTPEAIDLTKLNIWRIRFGWLGAAPVKLEVVSPDGEWITAHTLRYPNTAATPSIYSTDLPITAHLVKTSGATNVQFNTACWGAGTTYDKVDIVGSNTLGTAANSVVNYNVQGVGTLQLRCGTTTTGTVIFEATVDGTTWITHPYCYQVSTAGNPDIQITAAVTPTSANLYRMQCTGFRGVRVRTATLLGATAVFHAQGDAKASMVNIAGLPSFIGGGFGVLALKHTTVTTAVTNAAIITVAAGTRIAVTQIQVTLDNASTVFPSVLIGFATSTTPTTTGVIASHGGVPAGGGFSRGDGSGVIGIGASDEDLRITTVGNATGNGLHVVVTYMLVPA